MRFSQADSTSSHARTPWYCQPKKSHDIVTLSFCNIIKGQANYAEKLVKNGPKYVQIIGPSTT